MAEAEVSRSTSKVVEVVAAEQEEETEPLFDLGALFGQKKVNHGDPNHAFEYPVPTGPVRSAFSNGIIRVHLPDSSVTLMAQYVWQSAISLADLLALGDISVAGDSVVELGAGSALPSIVAAASGARRLVVSDYPEEEIVATMKRNVKENLSEELLHAAKGSGTARVSVVGFKWGEDVEDLLAVNDQERFDVILMADTLWLEEEHTALAGSCDKLLKESGRIVLTYMDHDNQARVANAFITRMTSDHPFQVVSERTIEWNSDKDKAVTDPEEYGPVFLKIFKRRA